MSNKYQLHQQETYHAKGKFLLSAEYFVLDGALSLALPLRLGQRMDVGQVDHSNSINWKSYNNEKKIWFEAHYDLSDFSIQDTNDQKTAASLQEIFFSIKKQNPQHFEKGKGLEIKTYLDFPRLWGLGTSSTLIHLLAQWSSTNPYQILKETFGGSGYDIACAGAEGPIFYKRNKEDVEVQVCKFVPDFHQKLYFVYLGKKQNSREGIKHYRALTNNNEVLIKRFSEITRALILAQSLETFDALIFDHETLIAESLQLQRAKTLHFSDFWGEVKSLGAWGGDFVLVTSARSFEETKRYFNEKGFDVFIKYKEMVF